jgi:hypothetical protein
MKPLRQRVVIRVTMMTMVMISVTRLEVMGEMIVVAIMNPNLLHLDYLDRIEFQAGRTLPNENWN